MNRQFYWLSGKFPAEVHGPFAEGVALVIEGGEGYFRAGHVMEHMKQLIQEGVSFPTQLDTEIGRWDQRYLVELEPMPSIDLERYYAWAGPGFCDYDPPLVTYTKAEFMTLFEDCCRNFVLANLDRREEFALALLANGMSLERTAERP